MAFCNQLADVSMCFVASMNCSCTRMLGVLMSVKLSAQGPPDGLELGLARCAIADSCIRPRVLLGPCVSRLHPRHLTLSSRTRVMLRRIIRSPEIYWTMHRSPTPNQLSPRFWIHPRCSYGLMSCSAWQTRDCRECQVRAIVAQPRLRLRTKRRMSSRLGYTPGVASTRACGHR